MVKIADIMKLSRIYQNNRVKIKFIADMLKNLQILLTGTSYFQPKQGISRKIFVQWIHSQAS